MSCYIGVDLGATCIKLALLAEDWKVVKRIELSTADFPKKSLLIRSLEKHILRLGESLKVKPKGVGIGVPGLVDPEKGLIHYLVNIPGWENVHLKKILEKSLEVPVFIDNDVNLMALAELCIGQAKGKKNVVCITLGTGVGGGLVLEGKLYRGTSFSAGEIGHIPLNETGPVCNCGGIACLERYVGNRYIIEKARDKLKQRSSSIISDLIKDDFSRLTPEILSRALKKGDSLAKEIWQDIGRKIGIVLSGVVNLLNPEMIIIGGGIAQVGEVLFKTIKETIKKRAMRIPAEKVSIVPAKLKKDAGLIGAAILVKLEGARRTIPEFI
ncbi:MAG: ROK family protein [Candidatus Omnitrophica bacterium]|nr:ROK family protein [Candidatus Omnitrophota bacterium]MCM8797872.1 ROK family protein [Candidatus Omnitrophota bacterium]